MQHRLQKYNDRSTRTIERCKLPKNLWAVFIQQKNKFYKAEKKSALISGLLGNLQPWRYVFTGMAIADNSLRFQPGKYFNVPFSRLNEKSISLVSLEVPQDNFNGEF